MMQNPVSSNAAAIQMNLSLKSGVTVAPMAAAQQLESSAHVTDAHGGSAGKPPDFPEAVHLAWRGTVAH